MNAEMFNTIATSGICAVLLCGVLFGIYKVTMSLISNISETIKNTIFHVTVDSKQDNTKQGEK